MVDLNLNHFGDGTQIAGNFIGDIIYELDPKSRATLAKLSEDAPALARLLEEAIRDGLISPDIVDGLRSALDEDVLHVLRMVGRHLSEENLVALQTAGAEINKAVTKDFDVVNDKLNARLYEINAATESLRTAIGQSGTASRTGNSRTGKESFLPAPRRPGKWQVRFGWNCCSSAVGLVAAMILIRFHHEGYAMLAVAVIVFSAILLFSNARR
jgi:hypothetical protein